MPHPERVGKTRQFYTVFQYSHPDSNSLGPTILKHRNPIMKEGGVLVLQKLHHSIYDPVIVFKMATTQVGYELGRSQMELRRIKRMGYQFKATVG